MKLPSRLAGILGVGYAVMLAVSTQIQGLSTGVHAAIGAVLVILATLIDPLEGIATGRLSGPPYDVGVPVTAAPAAPAPVAPAPATPAAQSLP
jgi:hypothetical protein